MRTSLFTIQRPEHRPPSYLVDILATSGQQHGLFVTSRQSDMGYRSPREERGPNAECTSPMHDLRTLEENLSTEGVEAWCTCVNSDGSINSASLGAEIQEEVCL